MKLYTNKVNLQPRCIENLLLWVYIVILKVFLPSVYKFGTEYTLVYRYFRIYSNWTQFRTDLIFLKGVFQKNGNPKIFIDKCFKKFLNNLHLVKENVPTVEKKRLLLVLPYLRIIYLQTTTKLQQALKGVLNCCKLEIAFKG